MNWSWNRHFKNILKKYENVNQSYLLTLKSLEAKPISGRMLIGENNIPTGKYFKGNTRSFIKMDLFFKKTIFNSNKKNSYL